jgi:hypothetical protein
VLICSPLALFGAMIRSNNPSIDAEALMRRVRDEADRLRAGGALEDARRQRWDAGSNRLTEIIDRQNAIIVFLNDAEHRNQPRTQVPYRLTKLHGMGEKPVQFMLRIFNYLFKQQREVDVAQNAALREMTWLVVAAAQDLTNLTKRVSELTERLERLESNIEKTP